MELFYERQDKAILLNACYICLRDKKTIKFNDGTFGVDPFIGLGGSEVPPFKIRFYDYPKSEASKKLVYCKECMHHLHRYWDECLASIIRGRIASRKKWEEKQKREKEKKKKHNKRRREIKKERKKKRREALL